MHYVRQTLHFSQNDLARALGVSRRTGQRWTAGSGPVGTDLHKMARLVYPADAALAAEIAAAAGTTLDGLGVLPPPPPPPEPPHEPTPPADWIVDAAVVCAAAEAMQVMPQSVRPAVLAAFACARELGLTVEGVERVLRSRLPSSGAHE
jgi:transcriptional regulator with XRE-family HTH domain